MTLIEQTRSCPLCTESAGEFYVFRSRLYLQCSGCQSVFLDPKEHLDYAQEKKRYLSHQNDVEDPKYQAFVFPLVNQIMHHFSNESIGLDFGAGPGPVTSKLLKDNGYLVEMYDPFFWNYPEKLKDKYDFIVLCEVMEHFRDPAHEFSILRNLLKPNGKLFCKTSLYSESLDFEKWYYKNDQTHIFFYHKEAISYICSRYHFSDAVIDEKFIIFST